MPINRTCRVAPKRWKKGFARHNGINRSKRKGIETGHLAVLLLRGSKTMLTCHSLLKVGLLVMALSGVAAVCFAGPPVEPQAAPAPGPAYQFLLRSRHAEVTPTRTRDAQTGGGSIVVEQPEPNTVVVRMSGSAVVGSDCQGSAAATMDFNLEQDLDIIPTRQGVRPPRVGLIGRVVGTLLVTNPTAPCCNKSCGTAEQGPASACLTLGHANLLEISVKSTAIACGQESSINFREGPVECVTSAGPYRLTGSYRLGVTQGKGVFYRQAAVADFDPAPQLDAFWADALKPFRAVPRKDFGFQVVVRVVEDAAPMVDAIK
jgi:hypothetical protein